MARGPQPHCRPHSGHLCQRSHQRDVHWRNQPCQQCQEWHLEFPVEQHAQRLLSGRPVDHRGWRHSLHQPDDQLNDTVNELESTNQQLQERDKIKEQYLGRFLTFSSNLIDKNETQRKALNRLAMEDRLKELKAQLKSPHLDYENATLFYQNFDSAFLNIYPNFIQAVNSLLEQDQHIEPKDGEQLTRELRILALIRLGITDNKEIASILRASIATIYTYRSRLKARAISKDSFEDDIKHIQALS